MTKKLIIIFHIFFVLSFFSNPANWIKPTFKKVHVHFKSKVSSEKSLKQNTNYVSHNKIAQQKIETKPDLKKHKEVKKTPQKQTQKKPIETKKVEKNSLKTKQKTSSLQKEETPEEINKETIAKIFEKIDKLEKITNNEHTAAANDFTQHQATQEDDNSGEISDVIEYLFEILELPGPGKVTVEMFLTKDGKIDKINILQSENPENSQYLILKLKDIVLPFHKKGLVPSSMKVCFSNLKA